MSGDSQSESGSDSEARTAAPAAATVVRVGLHGAVSKFDGNQEEWAEYAEQLEHYFIANDIEDAKKKRAILLTAVGPQTFRLIKTLSLPKAPKDFTFEQLVEKVKTHFNPKPSPIVKRFEFNTRCQEEGENVATFVAALRKISEHCDYGTTLNDMLRDRLVCGIRDKRVQRRLLQEVDLTYAKALDMAVAAETAEKDARSLRTPEDSKPASEEGKSVHRVGTRNPPGGRGKPAVPPRDAQGTECYRCGGKHPPTRCRFKDYDCHFCKRKGHLASVCKKRKEVKKEERANQVTEQVSDEYEDNRLYHISSGSTKPLVVPVNLDGQEVTMELDTGASVSLMSEEAFRQITTAPVQESKARLCTYTGESIPVVGTAEVTVRHNGQSAVLPLVITRKAGPSLLGRNWLTALRLDWQSILQVKTKLTLQEVLDKHKEVFRDELGKVRGTKAKLYIEPGATPRYHKPRPVPYAWRQKVEEELDRLQSLGVIEPVQFSDWAAPIVPVPKRDGSIRICGDYKVTINQSTKLDQYPLPRIEDLFSSLAGGKTFTKLDLSQAYQQIELEEESRQYVTINTHKGLFRYNRLPFGVSSAPSIFQRIMENILQGIPGVSVFIDDILITGATEQEHLANLAAVLQRLMDAGVRLKREKCKFLLPSVDYLGHTISADGLHTSDAKVQAIVEAPPPRNVAELRSFLGLVNYYSKFLPSLSTVLSPLYLLLQKHREWRWSHRQKKAFSEVKDLLKSSRVLTHFDGRLPLILTCDASPYGIGAVLSHRMSNGEERPVGFASRTLSTAECKYSQLDKEALALVFGVRKFNQYLCGREFTLKTDHKPLIHIFKESKATPTMASGRIQRWALTLGAYKYTIQFKEGKANANADAMSRLPLPPSTSQEEPPKPPEIVQVMEYLDTSPVSSSQVKTWTDRDPVLSKVRDWVLTGWPASGSKEAEREELRPFFRRRFELSVEDKCLLWGNRVVVPKKGQEQVIRMLHEAHPGIVKMKCLARSYVWWPSINEDLEKCVRTCELCQSSRKSPPVVPLHPWAWPDKPWSRVHIDYAGPFLGKMFLLLIDAHSKWMEVHMTSTSTSEASINLMRKSFATLGVPDVIVSDNATAFTSGEFEQFLSRNGIRHVRTPPYHPASNGLAERAVQTFKEGMKRLQEGSVETKLSRFLFKYRMTPHSSTGVSPAERIFGRRLRSPLDNLHPDHARRAREVQDQQKQGHDAHAQSRGFAIGDLVYARNYGSGLPWLPGKVTGVQGSVLYTVLLEDGRSVQRHADQLRSRVTRTEDSAADSDPDVDISVPDGVGTPPPMARRRSVTEGPPDQEGLGDTSAPPELQPALDEDSAPVSQEPPLPAEDPGGDSPEGLPPSTPHQASVQPQNSPPTSEVVTESTVPPENRQSTRCHNHPNRYGNFIYY